MLGVRAKVCRLAKNPTKILSVGLPTDELLGGWQNSSVGADMCSVVVFERMFSMLLCEHEHLFWEFDALESASGTFKFVLNFVIIMHTNIQKGP